MESIVTRMSGKLSMNAAAVARTASRPTDGVPFTVRVPSSSPRPCGAIQGGCPHVPRHLLSALAGRTHTIRSREERDMSRAIRSSSSSPGDGLVDGLRTGLLALAIAGCGGAADEGGEAQSGERIDAGVAAYSLSAPVEDAERRGSSFSARSTSARWGRRSIRAFSPAFSMRWRRRAPT